MRKLTLAAIMAVSLAACNNPIIEAIPYGVGFKTSQIDDLEGDVVLDTVVHED